MPNCLGKGLGPTGVLQQGAARRLLGGLVGRQAGSSASLRDSPQGDRHSISIHHLLVAGGMLVVMDGRMDRGGGRAAVLH